MAVLDDERFERYLKQFRPDTPEPLPIERRGRAMWRRCIFALPAAAAVAVLVASVLAIHFRRRPAQSPTVKNMAAMSMLRTHSR